MKSINHSDSHLQILKLESNRSNTLNVTILLYSVNEISDMCL